ncbi:ABC transporter permease [Saccharopolyspora phatthalungensis]|uniref:Peptide/nickel transport system permease protein n=1 Tax=Saccharopolyspora phatthalungensis TaxID=664693 RepID=A0A840QH70_9PSEU|nr:ABC transporter permease [Saccharopolyspora phatthalungensis]MBB5159856.1 peptide/nickel transport system permease protein [Saccharopolyspora phatthalungensis]
MQVGYVLRRIGQALLVVWAVVTIAFIVLYAMPGDPAELMLSGGSAGVAISPEDLARVRAEYGLDRPLWMQYVGFLGGVLHGDLGTSFLTHERVSEVLVSALGSTTQVVLLAAVLSVVIGVALGTSACTVRAKWLRGLMTMLPPLGASLPTFWVALLLMQVLSFQLNWLPAAGNSGFASLVLPAVTLAMPGSAYVAQVFAASLRTTLREPFVEIARSRGASDRRVLVRQAMGNALLPTITVLGIVVASQLAFSTITETVFGRRGLGSLLHTSVLQKDIPVVLALILVIAVVYAGINLVVDLAYPLLDPRVRLTGATAPSRRRTATADGALT